MPHSQTVLIVGGGIAGMSCAIAMARAGHNVTIVDLDAEWKSYGAGITLQAATFRALHQLGLAEQVIRCGAACRGTRLRLAGGGLVDEVVSQGLEAGLPDCGGILRPVLHGIMANEVRRCGVGVRLGVSIAAFDHSDDKGAVLFSDGSYGAYDLIVGADGIFSHMRGLLFPDLQAPRFTGQAAFRVTAARPAELDMIETYMGNPIKAGVVPISDDKLYMFVLSPEQSEARMAHGQLVARLRETLADFGGLISEIRDSLGPDSEIVYRPLHTIFLEKPWHRGRAILIGDAAHATTPQLGSGAGSAIEDGILLSEYVTACATIDEGLRAFTERRFDRCRHVVESSVRLGELELAGAPGQEQGRVYADALTRLATPA